MSQYTEGGLKTFESGAAIKDYSRIQIGSDRKVTTAGASAVCDGTAERAAFDADEYIPVRLKNAPGTRQMIAAGAISAGASVYAAADGEIAATGSILEGKALEAATAKGDIIEVMTGSANVSNSPASVAATGSDQAGAAAVTGSLVLATASDGTKGVRLPAISVGTVVEIYNSVASQGLKVYPATGGNINGGSANAAVTIAGKTFAKFVAVDATTWAAIYTAP